MFGVIFLTFFLLLALLFQLWQYGWVYAKILITSLLFFFSLINNVNAQKYITNFTNYSTKDGLSDNLVYRFHEDQKGFIWIGTRKGLNRFDGKSFKVFLQNGDKENSECTTIVEDVDGNIWTSFFKKRSKIKNRRTYYIIDKNYHIHLLDSFFKQKIPFDPNEIFWLAQSKDHVLYISTYDGQIFKYDRQFTLLVSNPDYKKAIISQKIEDNGDIHLISNNKIITLNKNGGVKNQYVIQEKANLNWWHSFFESGIMPNIHFDRENYELHEFFNIKDSPSDYSLEIGESIHHIIEKEKHFFLIRKKNHLLLFNQQKELVYDFSKEFSENLPNTHISYPPLIRNNQIWFGNNQGFTILDYKQNPFDQYLNSGSFSTRGILSLHNDNLLVVGYRQTSEINEEKQTIKPLKNLSKVAKRGAVQYDSTTLVFGTYGSELVFYDKHLQQSKHIALRASDLKKKAYFVFLIPFVDRQKNIWIGSMEGLAKYDSEMDSIVYIDDYGKFPELRETEISFFKEDKEGIWLGTANGLYLFDPEKGVTDYFTPLPELNVKHFHKEGDVFWLATIGKGLVKWNMKTGETQVFGKNQGVLNENIMAVYPDTIDNLWLSSEEGLIKFEKTTGAVEIYLESNGITHNEFNNSSHFQGADGKLYFGGLNGVTAFYPEKIEFIPEAPSAFIVTDYYQLESGEQVNRMGDFLNQSVISLSDEIKSATLHFSLLNYKNVNNTRYAYKIEGLEQELTLQSENFIRLNRLPYGDYTLKIKAQDYTGKWIENEISIPIKVIPPFYKRAEYQAIGLGLFLLFTYLIFRWRLNLNELEKIKLENIVTERTAELEVQKSELKKLNQTKDRLFTVLAHDLRNPVIAFQDISESLDYLLEKNDIKRIKYWGNSLEKEAQELYHLLDNLLNWALAQRNELDVDTRTFDLSEVAKGIISSTRNISQMKEIILYNEVPSDFEITTDRRIIEMVFRNIVSNAFRYTKKGGWIKIGAKKTDSSIEIRIQDNGAGMSPQKLEKLFQLRTGLNDKKREGDVSIGLHLCQELLLLINGSILVNSTEGAGTTFILHLPKKYSTP